MLVVWVHDEKEEASIQVVVVGYIFQQAADRFYRDPISGSL
jgi:hypothetical protein